MQTLKQVRKSDLSELPVECVDLIALGVYSLYTSNPRYTPKYFMVDNHGAVYGLSLTGYPEQQLNRELSDHDIEQACIIVDG